MNVSTKLPSLPVAKEERLRRRLFQIVAIPVPLALCFYLVLRSLHQRILSKHLTESGGSH